MYSVQHRFNNRFFFSDESPNSLDKVMIQKKFRWLHWKLSQGHRVYCYIGNDMPFVIKKSFKDKKGNLIVKNEYEQEACINNLVLYSSSSEHSHLDIFDSSKNRITTEEYVDLICNCF